jgi:rubrerythrin
MFLIAGISPKTKQLDANPRRCPVCGLRRAYYKRIDHYFSLFFIPIFRVKKGEPFIMCDSCEKSVPQYEQDYYPGTNKPDQHCRYCGSTLQSGFKYCPYCGKPI